jgi:polyphosphate glucokinase
MPLGVALPCVIRQGVIFTAANLHASLIGTNIQAQLRTAIGQRVACLNDADAAGLAEVRWGAARGVRGTVMVLTFGTGIGSALFVDGRLVPNTELGHMEVGGIEGEQRASARMRTAEGLDWAQWCERVNIYLDAIDRLFWPEMIVIGGGVSSDYAEFGSLLRSRAALAPARLGAAAGVVGAAMAVAGPSP